MIVLHRVASNTTVSATGDRFLVIERRVNMDDVLDVSFTLSSFIECVVRKIFNGFDIAHAVETIDIFHLEDRVDGVRLDYLLDINRGTVLVIDILQFTIGALDRNRIDTHNLCRVVTDIIAGILTLTTQWVISHIVEALTLVLKLMILLSLIGGRKEIIDRILGQTIDDGGEKDDARILFMRATRQLEVNFKAHTIRCFNGTALTVKDLTLTNHILRSDGRVTELNDILPLIWSHLNTGDIVRKVISQIEQLLMVVPVIMMDENDLCIIIGTREQDNTTTIKRPDGELTFRRLVKGELNKTLFADTGFLKHDALQGLSIALGNRKVRILHIGYKHRFCRQFIYIAKLRFYGHFIFILDHLLGIHVKACQEQEGQEQKDTT